jgi:hypothetical protein
LEWFEEIPEGSDKSNNLDIVENYVNVMGRYILSTARYFVRMANQLLVEDEGFGQDSKGFVMLTADLNVRLRWCHKGRGAEDFLRLITDNLTQYTPGRIVPIFIIFIFYFLPTTFPFFFMNIFFYILF